MKSDQFEPQACDMAMPEEPRRIYLHRTDDPTNGRGTVLCAAPVDLVLVAYGSGGHHNHEAVERAFGGTAFYRNDETGLCFLGVWGARNASRFRTALRRKAMIEVVREPPPAR